MALVEMLVNNLLGRMVDTDLTVRMLCIRGLGNLSSAGPAQVTCDQVFVVSDVLATVFIRCSTIWGVQGLYPSPGLLTCVIHADPVSFIV